MAINKDLFKIPFKLVRGSKRTTYLLKTSIPGRIIVTGDGDYGQCEYAVRAVEDWLRDYGYEFTQSPVPSNYVGKNRLLQDMK